MKRGLCTALLLAVWLCPPAGARADGGPSAPQGAALRIEYEAGRVTLEARNVPLANVLLALGAKAGYRTDIVGDPGRTVDLSMTDKPLDVAIRKLVGDLSLVMIMRPRDSAGSGAPVRQIFVIAPDDPSGPHGPAVGERPTPPASDQSVSWNAALSRERQLDVLEGLAASGGKNAVGKIEQAIANNSEPEIREAAVQALSSIDDQAATLALGRILFGNYDGETQRLALRALAAKRGAAARAFLEHVAQDAKSENRDLAADLLARLR